jgi:hypothetical protein
MLWIQCWEVEAGIWDASPQTYRDRSTRSNHSPRRSSGINQWQSCMSGHRDLEKAWDNSRVGDIQNSFGASSCVAGSCSCIHLSEASYIYILPFGAMPVFLYCLVSRIFVCLFVGVLHFSWYITREKPEHLRICLQSEMHQLAKEIKQNSVNIFCSLAVVVASLIGVEVRRSGTWTAAVSRPLGTISFCDFLPSMVCETCYALWSSHIHSTRKLIREPAIEQEH